MLLRSAITILGMWIRPTFRKNVYGSTHYENTNEMSQLPLGYLIAVNKSANVFSERQAVFIPISNGKKRYTNFAQNGGEI